jgi:hypothetical protein
MLTGISSRTTAAYSSTYKVLVFSGDLENIDKKELKSGTYVLDRRKV